MLDDRMLRRLLDELLAEVRAARSWTILPTVLTKKRAAGELGVSLSKLKLLIRRGDLAVCTVGRTTMVPASEVYRLARPRSSTTPPRSARARGKRKQHSPAEEARKVRESLKSKPRRPRRAP